MKKKTMLFVMENQTWIKILLLAMILLVAAAEPTLADRGTSCDWCDSTM